MKLRCFLNQLSARQSGSTLISEPTYLQMKIKLQVFAKMVLVLLNFGNSLHSSSILSLGNHAQSKKFTQSDQYSVVTTP